MFNSWFGNGIFGKNLFRNNDTVNPGLGGFEKNGNGICRSERNDLKRLLATGQAPVEWPERSASKTAAPSMPPAFEQIYQAAAVKPPKLAYGIEKVAEMGSSPHLEGMSPTFKRKALMMALDAAGIEVGEILNDMVARQRALKEYEEAWLEKVTRFEEAEAEQNRLQKAELEKITGQYKARFDASLGEVERWHQSLREWQKIKQQELQRLTEAAALCVPHEAAEEEESDGKLMVMAQRAGGAYR